MSIEEQIIEYLFTVSRGKIKATPAIVSEIIQIAQGRDGGTAVCKLMRWNEVKRSWEVQYAVKSTDEEINLQVRAALDRPQVDRCYKWECYNSHGQLEGNIFTVNTNLF